MSDLTSTSISKIRSDNQHSDDNVEAQGQDGTINDVDAKLEIEEGSDDDCNEDSDNDEEDVEEEVEGNDEDLLRKFYAGELDEEEESDGNYESEEEAESDADSDFYEDENELAVEAQSSSSEVNPLKRKLEE